MAENKKSFILYADMIAIIDELPRETKADLLQLIFDYVNDRNPEPTDILLKTAFTPIKQQLKRDLQNWEAERSKRSEAGKAGGIKSGVSRRSRSKRSSASKNEANEADNVTVTVNDTVTVEIQTNNIFFEMFRRVAGYSIQDSELRSEIGRFRNKYPNVHPNQAGALINTWVANIGREPALVKKMIL